METIMLHKKLGLLLLSLLLVLSLGYTALAQDETEEQTGVLILADGDEVESFLSLDVQTRAYVFNGNEGDEITVTMETENEDLDTFLVVLGTDGALLASNDDDGGTDRSTVEAELPATGSYMILASSYHFIDDILDFEVEDEMEFTLSLEGNSEVEDLADGFALTFEPIEGDDTFEGELDDDIQAAFYVFNGEEGDEVNLSVSTEEFYSIIHVFGPTGDRVAVATGYNDEEPGSELSLELPEDGSYLVVVTDIFFYTAFDEESYYTGGEYELEVSFE
jgi:hypothetical protein